ncbi:MAG: polysaccharide deacetylase family protein [Cyclobacteriaceae bacterium]
MRSLFLYSLVLLSALSCRTVPEEKKKASDIQDRDLNPPKASPLEKEVVCFVYHRFGDGRYPSTNISTGAFETQLKWLVDNKFQVLTFSQAIEYLRSSEAARRTAVLTIDDGYKSFYENGLPLLKKYKIPATLYINTETVGAGDYMNWEQLANAAKSGVEIGNHTHTHDYFLNQSASDRYTNFASEIETSQKLSEQNLGIVPSSFAYPYGEFDEKMRAIVKTKGFKGAAAQNSGILTSETDLFQIPRFPMSDAYAEGFPEKALMGSFKIRNQPLTPGLVYKSEKKPPLSLTLRTRGIRIDQMQCFVQGNNCTLNINKRSSEEIILTIQPTDPIINRRRTLYTLTAQDSLGQWRWYSHLWIDPNVK